MIAPPAGNFQIARRKPFQSKSKAFDERSRRRVSGLDVGFKAMKFQSAKGIGEYGCEAAGHVPLIVMRCERVIAKIGRVEVAANDFADVDDAGKFARFRNDPVSTMGLSPKTLEIFGELSGSLRGGRPSSVKSPASSDCGEEFILPSNRRALENVFGLHFGFHMR